MALRSDIDADGLLEYSVVYTDRALNHMSKAFQQVMKDISATLKQVYNAEAAVVVPGSGTFAMEAVARQLATGKKTMVIRNGWFSYRWSQILDRGNIAAETNVLTATQTSTAATAPFTPVAVDKAVAAIKAYQPDILFMPHVETASGIMLPDAYIKAIADAVHDGGGVVVLDCIASGTVWVDMVQTQVDVLISAPQKGWSGAPCAGLVMLNERALTQVEQTTSTSFSCDLHKWLDIMRAYENGGHAYHATMPTDTLRQFRDVMLEAKTIGFDKLKAAQMQLGEKVRTLLEAKGFASVAAEGFQAPGVVVSYTERDDIHNGSAFVAQGMQVAAGVPLQCNEPQNFKTFRVGLFGLDKLTDVAGAVSRFEAVLDKVVG